MENRLRILVESFRDKKPQSVVEVTPLQGLEGPDRAILRRLSQISPETALRVEACY